MRGFHENRQYQSSLKVTVNTNENMSFRSHWHTDIELAYVLEGSIIIGNNNTRKELFAGEFMISSNSEIHDYKTEEGMKSKLLLLIFHPFIIDRHVDWVEKLKWVEPFLKDQDNIIQQHLFSLQAELDAMKPYYKLKIQGKLLCMISDLLRLYSSNEVKVLSYSMKLTKSAIEFIESNFKSNITLDSISEHVSLNRFYFCKLFKRVTGMNFNEYVNLVRVEYCEKQIRESKKSITDIALEAGFGSIRTFNRVFLEIMGCKPSNIRYR